MRRLAWLAAAMSLGGSSAAWAVEQSLGVDGALGVSFVRDDLLVPYAFTGGRLELGLRYRGVLGPGVLSASVRAAASLVAERFGNAGLVLDRAVAVRYAWSVGESEGWSMSFGPALGWDSDVMYLESWDDAHGYWITTRWFGATGQAFKLLSGGWRLDVSMDLPLVGTASRPAAERLHKQEPLTDFAYYFDDVERGAQPGSLNLFQLLRLTAEVWRSASSSPVPDGLGLGVELRLAHVAEPESAFSIQAMLRASYVWGW